jgi:hypothetical protein
MTHSLSHRQAICNGAFVARPEILSCRTKCLGAPHLPGGGLAKPRPAGGAYSRAGASPNLTSLKRAPVES